MMAPLNWVRRALGEGILLVDRITRPAWPERSSAQQAALDRETEALALYQFHLCPFCVKTRRAMHRMGLNIRLHDAKNDPDHKQRLVGEGGEYKVPCLAIESDGQTRWMYESDDIIAYLEERFAGR